MKIYTKTGDDGSTSLFGGNRIYKNNERVEAYGNIDELNAHIGYLIDSLIDQEIKNFLFKIQNNLFIIGSHLATVDKKFIKTLPIITEEDIVHLEQKIDLYNESLPVMKHFILPGGHLSVSSCHITRTVCRRAERSIVSVSQHETINPIIVKYLNRLSDYLFILSRKLLFDLNLQEIYWKGKD